MNYEMIADELLGIAETGFHAGYRNLKREYFTPENMVLIRLARSNEGIVYAGTLSSYIAVATSRMAVILNDLEKQGMVERKVDERDSRKRIVVATEKGREKGVRLLEEIRSNCAKLLENLGEEDALKLVDITRKMTGAMEQC
ncbi:MAG: MarR family winged helix-turn-helix transcriptional regulator [Bulleidia sp.]